MCHCQWQSEELIAEGAFKKDSCCTSSASKLQLETVSLPNPNATLGSFLRCCFYSKQRDEDYAPFDWRSRLVGFDIPVLTWIDFKVLPSEKTAPMDKRDVLIGPCFCLQNSKHPAEFGSEREGYFYHLYIIFYLSFIYFTLLICKFLSNAFFLVEFLRMFDVVCFQYRL